MDQELRDLERQAQTGDTEAEKRLILKQLRLGLEPYKKLYLRLSSEFLGVPIAFDYAKNRWVPEMEGSTFYEYFLTYGNDEATLVAANSLGTDSEEVPEASWPPKFQDYLEEYDALFAEGFHLLSEIDVLETLRLSNLYLPGTYDKEEIQEYEDAPEYPAQEIKILIKRPREEAEILTVYTDSEWITKLLGGSSWERRLLSNQSNISMFVRDEGPTSLQPNFVAERSTNMRTTGIQVIVGPAVFTIVEVPEFESIDWSPLPWPWNEIAAEDPDQQCPAELEYQTLSAKDITQIKNFIKPLSLELPDVTHFTFQGREAHLYSIDQCDKCGEDCIAPNSLKTRATRAELLASDLLELGEEPPELAGWSEEFGGALCDNCYSQEAESRRNPDEELRNLERQWHLEGSPDAYQIYAKAVKRAGLDPACYVCRKNVVPGNFLWCDQCQITVCYGCVTPCGHADCLSESEEAQAKARIEYHPDPLPLGHNRCPECADSCDACPRPLCPNHQDNCKRCDKSLCQIGEHTAECGWCENYYCLSHLNDGSEFGYNYICLSCESVAQGGQDWRNED